MEHDEAMNRITTIHVAADHAGFEHKEIVKEWLESEGYEVIDHGAPEYDEDDDYPDYIALAAHAIAIDAEGQARAIIFGGSGQGEAILANRFPNVRAIVFNGQYQVGDREIPEEITTARQHNNANILSIGARFLNRDETMEAVEQFLDTEFSYDERHQRRLDKIEAITRQFIDPSVLE